MAESRRLQPFPQTTGNQAVLHEGLSGLVTASDLLAAGLRQRHPLQEPVA